ncbi:MAG: RNA-binding protein [Bacteroidales bacterium]|jgi:RNA recognition motif-containing protein
MNIFIGSLPYSLEESKLGEYFENYGEVSSVKIITDKFTGRSKGFGFVEMPDDELAQKAIDELNGTEIQGRSIVVNKAEEKKERTGGSDSRRGNDRGGYNKGGYNKGNSRDGNRRSSY